MYCEFYQLTERPFNVTPDPKFLYLNARYREALASLNYGITQRKGFITLIGEAGTGKTTLLKKLLEDLDTKTKSVFIFNTNVTFEEILEYIFAEFDLPVHNGKKLYMLQRLNSFLLEELRGGSNVALLIDEAQDLEFSVLEDLRLLSNLETAKEKILQIVLSGQPELGQKLSNPILRQLRQRIGINCRLLPLSRDEITEYIRFRLQAAGCPDLRLFSREAEDQIYHFSRGIPRLVNVVCDNALVIGYALGKKRIGADVITEAAADLLSVELSTEESHTAQRPISVSAAQSPAAAQSNRWRARLGVAGLVLAAMVVGLLSVGRTTFKRKPQTKLPVPAASQSLEVIRPGSQPQGTGVGYPAPAGIGANDANDEAPNRGLPDAPAAKGLAMGEPQNAPAAKAPAPVEVVAPSTPRGDADRVAKVDEQAPSRVPHALEHNATTERQAAHPIERPIAPKAAERPAPQDAPRLAANPAEQSDPDRLAKTDAPLRPSAEAAVQPPAHAPEHSEDAVQPAPDSGESDGAADAPEPVQTGAPPRLDGIQFARVVVHGGDSMSAIAARKYGQASYTILDLLKLANPELRDIDLISVGQTIRLPELSEGFPILNDGSGHYALLVFSTPQLGRASNLRKALHARGFEVHVSGGNVGAQKPIYRVAVSGFTDRDEVVAVGKQLQRLFRDDTRIAQFGE